MPSFTIKVPNDDNGEDLGEYEADYLPRVGNPFVLYHRRVSPREHEPFCGIVSMVTHQAIDKDYDRAPNNSVVTTVWLVEEHAAPVLYCDCSEEERARHGVEDDGLCENCGHVRRVV